MTRALVLLATTLFVSSLTVAVLERESSHELGSGLRVYATTSDTVRPTTTSTETTLESPVSARQTSKASTYRPAVVEASGTIPDIIRAGFARFGPDVAEQAVRVASCETGGTFNPNATGSQGEVGLFQLHPRYQSGRAAKFGWTMNDLYDPAKNITVAADLYSESGWRQWTCRSAL